MSRGWTVVMMAACEVRIAYLRTGHSGQVCRGSILAATKHKRKTTDVLYVVGHSQMAMRAVIQAYSDRIWEVKGTT